MYNIVMMGIQGSGKGTQSEMLQDRMGIPAISVGKLFRAESERGTGLGREIMSYLNRGEMVPSEVVNQVMSERLSEDDTARGVIIDGYPRTVQQAEALDAIMGGLDRHITHVIDLELEDAEVLKRLSGRRVCSNQDCELNYHIEFNPPKGRPDRCDRCGSELIQRKDDVPEAIQHRIRDYHQSVAGIKDFYDRKGVLHRIDGSSSIEAVSAAIAEALGL